MQEQSEATRCVPQAFRPSPPRDRDQDTQKPPAKDAGGLRKHLGTVGERLDRGGKPQDWKASGLKNGAGQGRGDADGQNEEIAAGQTVDDLFEGENGLDHHTHP